MKSPDRRCSSRLIWLLVALTALIVSTAAQNVEPTRIVAIGDVHGDVDAFAGILENAGITDSSGRWIAGKTTLVQTGDVTDRGPKVRAAMDLLMQLEQQAKAQGGRVAVLLGNHEIMNLIGDLRDVTPEIFLTFADAQSEKRRDAAYDAYVRWCRERGGQFQQPPRIYQPVGKSEWQASHPLGYVEYRSAFAQQGRYGRWLRTRQPLLQLHDTVFLHAGINPDRAPRRLEEVNQQVLGEIRRWDETFRRMVDRRLVLPFFTLTEVLTVAQIEMQIAEALAKQPDVRDAAPLAGDPLGLKGLLNIESWALVDPDGPMWFRGFATWSPEAGAPRMKELLSRYNVARFVTGHTVQEQGRISRRFDGSVYLIDTGMLSSVYRGGRASALEIHNGQLTAIYADGRTTLSGAIER